MQFPDKGRVAAASAAVNHVLHSSNPHKMKKILLVFPALLTICLLQAQRNGQAPYLTKSLTSDGLKEVRAETEGGNVSLQGVDPSQARIEVYVWADNNRELSRDEIKERLESYYDLSIESDHGVLTAKAIRKNREGSWNKHSLGISFSIYAPVGVSCDLNTSGGNVRLTNLSGESEHFRTSGGNLDIRQVSSKINGETSGGNINIDQGKQDIDLTTSGGNVEATHCSGRIRLKTSGGNVDGEDINGDLSASTSGGNVTLNRLSCSLETSTSGGNIHVRMDALGKFLSVHNSGGDIDLQLPGNQGMDLKLTGDKVSIDRLVNFSGKKTEEEIEGKMNGGGIPITVDGNSGRVRIEFK
jgi:hypothetical protein